MPARRHRRPRNRAMHPQLVFLWLKEQTNAKVIPKIANVFQASLFSLFFSFFFSAGANQCRSHAKGMPHQHPLCQASTQPKTTRLDMSSEPLASRRAWELPTGTQNGVSPGKRRLGQPAVQFLVVSILTHTHVFLRMVGSSW